MAASVPNLISSTESQTCSHLETSDQTFLKYSSLHSWSLKFYQNVNSFKDIFQKLFWTLEAAACRCCSTGVLRNSFLKERLRVAASLDFSGVPGWLLLKMSLSEVFPEELLTCLNKHPRFVYTALLIWTTWRRVLRLI